MAVCLEWPLNEPSAKSIADGTRSTALAGCDEETDATSLADFRFVMFSFGMRRELRTLAKTASLVALACMVSALAFPAVGTCYRGSNGKLPDWFDNQNILFFGWFAIFFGQLGWFANIPFVLNLVSLFRGRPPRWQPVAVEGILLLIAVVSLQPTFGMSLPHNEGYAEAVCYLGLGFWLWATGHAVILSAALFLRAKSAREGESVSR